MNILLKMCPLFSTLYNLTIADYNTLQIGHVWAELLYFFELCYFKVVNDTKNVLSAVSVLKIVTLDSVHISLTQDNYPILTQGYVLIPNNDLILYIMRYINISYSRE